MAEMQERYDNEIVSCGGRLQNITNCMRVLDNFLSNEELIIVSSVVVADKKKFSGEAKSIVDSVLNVLGISRKSVLMDSRLSEIGVDSITTSEIKQVLEAAYGIFMTPKEIREVTLTKLHTMENQKEDNDPMKDQELDIPKNLDGLFHFMGLLEDEVSLNSPIKRLSSLVNNESDACYIFIFAGIGGVSTCCSTLAKNLKAKVYSLQFSCQHAHYNVQDMVDIATREIENILKPGDPLHIISHSWGAYIGSETMSILEGRGFKGTFICLDCSPDLNCRIARHHYKDETCEEIETSIICDILTQRLPSLKIEDVGDHFIGCKDYQELVSKMADISGNAIPFSAFLLKIMVGLKTRVLISLNYRRSFKKIKSAAFLIRPVERISDIVIEEHYNLTEICERLIEIEYIEGYQFDMMRNLRLADYINKCISII